MTEYSKLQQLCSCRVKLYTQKEKTKDRCKKKRQVFVYNPEEEIWHEPYMQTLRREFSNESVECDSKIELPWRDIALPAAGMSIRPDTTLTPIIDRKTDETEIETVKTEKRESTVMTLPWQDLLITETLQSTQMDDAEICDSSVEIPWSDLALEKPIIIRPPIEEKTCVSDDVEIPWGEILVPRNIIIRPEKKRKHPSSGQPPRARVADTTCVVCGTYPCCAKTRADIKLLLGPLLACRLCVRAHKTRLT
nr:PREDICTED: uncharacterized protein LOC105668358 isoform X2 [Linepithema humile]